MVGRVGVWIRRLLDVIGPEFRGRVTLVFVLTTLVATLELLTVIGVLPLIALATRASTGSFGAAHRWLFGIAPSHLAIGFVIIVLVKPFIAAYTIHYGNRFAFDVQASLSTRILRGLVFRRYSFFLQNHSAILLKNVTTEVASFAGGVILPLTALVTQGMTLLAVVASLLLVSPAVALFVFSLVGLLAGGLYAVVNPRLAIWGRARERQYGDMYRFAQECLTGIKSVKAAQAEQWMVDRFALGAKQYAAVNTRYQTTAALPPLLIEMALFGSGIGTLAFYVLTGRSIMGIVPTLGVLVLAGYRILAATRAVFSLVVSVRFHWASLPVLEQLLDREEDGSAVVTRRAGSRCDVQDTITANGITFQYAGAASPVLRNITLTIPYSMHVAVVGGSGSGKTTLLDILLGLLSPSDGTVVIDGVPLTDDASGDWLRQVAYVPQSVFLLDATLRENILFGRVPDGEDPEWMEHVLDQAQLTTLIRTLPNGLETLVGENGARLSGGERQRIGIARALYRRPRVLILDEATSALDSITEQAVTARMLEACHGITVIVVAHRLSTVRHCDQVVLMNHGAIEAIGTYDEVVEGSEQFAKMHRLSAIA